MIRDTFFTDPRVSATAKGIGAFIAEHDDAVPLTHIVDFFRDAPLTIAYALDELEGLNYVRRIKGADNPTPDQIFYVANRDTLGGVTA